MSSLFCSRSLMTPLVYSTAPSTSLSSRIFFRHVPTTRRTSRQLSRRTVSMPLASSLSWRSGRVQYSPAYRFLFISRYGQYTFSNSSFTGLGNSLVTSRAASSPSFMADGTSGTPNLTMTESVSPYTTTASAGYPLAMVYMRSTASLVSSIMVRPYAVTDEEMARHGSCPTVAPVKPYTELADTLSASCRPFCTAFTIGSVASFMSALARLRAASSSSRICGSSPLCTSPRTNTSPEGVRSSCSSLSLDTSSLLTSVE
mmetsp:Transcript_30359/g.99138  ORF Transcript_30359/g.99138 Transcript_30359/m.99138 type:complete len:258 (-) Transcript_30359:1808-2581(-)